MAQQIFGNGASSTLLAAIGSSDTQVQVQAGDGALFPTLSSTDQFFVCAFEDALGNIEIVTVTGKTGDTFTIARGKEGTTPQNWGAGDRFELRVTAETLQNFAQKDGDLFTGDIRVPGIDLIPADPANPWNPFTYRFVDDGGVPTHQVSGPIDLQVAMQFSTFKAAGETFDWGINETGTFFTPGSVRWNWFDAAGADPAWYIDVETKKPESGHIRKVFQPSADAEKVSYRFITKTAAGTENFIDFNPDGSISAGGDFTFGSLSLPYAEDPDAEIMRGTFKEETLFLAGPGRILAFRPDNIGSDAGNPGSGIGYLLVPRADDGTEGFFAIYPNGTVWATGPAVFTSVQVSDQGTPDNVSPNTLVTKATAEQIAAGAGVGGSGHFSELLYDSPGGAGTGNIPLSNPLFTAPGTTHYQQFIVEAYFPNASGGPVYATMTFETAFVRTLTNYAIGPAFNADATGNIKFQLNSTYDQLQLSSEQGAVIRRVIGISYRGDPFP